VTEICRRLDGIPLAIELAAARTNILSLEGLAATLDVRFRILTGGDRAALPRQRTMQALFDWSYDLLAPEEQQLFEHLAVFAGGATYERVVAVHSGDGIDDAAIVELLASLGEKSLVTIEPAANPRYVLLESARQYAYEKLAARGWRRLRRTAMRAHSPNWPRSLSGRTRRHGDCDAARDPLHARPAVRPAEPGGVSDCVRPL
jgi:predicted ATPase